MGKGSKASITVFTALSLMLIAGFLFALLEAGRYYSIHKMSKIRTSSIAESIYSKYDEKLWKKYHLIAIDVGENLDGSDLVSDVSARLTGPDFELYNLVANDYLRFKATGISISNPLLMTDQEGDVFIKAVAAYEKKSMAPRALAKLMENSEFFNDIQSEDKVSSSEIDNATSTIEESESLSEEEEQARDDVANQESDDNSDDTEAVSIENPLDVVKDLMSDGVLNLVLGDCSQLSTKRINRRNLMTSRRLKTGSGLDAGTISVGVSDKVLLEYFIKSTFNNYVSYADIEDSEIGETGEVSSRLNGEDEDRALDYELEYIIAGNLKDKQNLAGTVERLIALRHIIDLAYIETDASRVAEAELTAAAISSVVLTPEATELVKHAILFAWSYVEAVLDVRALLAGRKISLTKTSASWVSCLGSLTNCMADHSKMAEASSSGLGYEEFTLALLLTNSSKKQAKRCMNLIEQNIRAIEGYEDFRMDQMAVQSNVKVNYKYRTIFLGMDGITNAWEKRNNFTDKINYSIME